ncbi:MAG: T9SS type A sorting domain-containing protein, partial [Candidatus Edwardsbacteria bacterium]|nr:T9SS type A sorting domain-containing protein [Candidatus Edwardsbacteria bacterium]
GTNPSGSIITATVWDMTNNIEVPLETGVTKANMTQSSWCFNPTATTCAGYVDSISTSRFGMYIAGVIIYFNRRNGGSLRNISTLWNLRPHTGDVWTVRCSGPTTPAQGAVATFIMTPAVPDDGQPYLLQNYPNPFSRSGTNIFYQVSGSGGDVNLRIYNITGQLVKTLVSENKAPGYYRAVWNGRTENGQKVSAGIYIYRLETAGKAITRRMVLIK